MEELVEDLPRIFHWTMAILILQLCLMAAWVLLTMTQVLPWRAVQNDPLGLAVRGWARTDARVTTGACHGDALPPAPQQPEGEAE